MDIAATLDFDWNAFEMPVDIFSNDIGLSVLAAKDPEAASAVRTFAADVSSSFAKSVEVALRASAPDVICVYRSSDASLLNLLTLDGPCAVSRALTSANSEQERRLETDGSGELRAGIRVEVGYDGRDTIQEIMGNHLYMTSHYDMGWIVAHKIETAEIVIKSDLLRGSAGIDANVSEIDVDFHTHAPTPTATPEPTWPTPEPTPLPAACRSSMGWYRAEKDQSCSNICRSCGKTCNSLRIALVNSLEIFQAIDKAIVAEGDRGPGFECRDVDAVPVSYAPGVCKNSGAPCHGEGVCIYRNDCPVDIVSGDGDCQNCADDSHYAHGLGGQWLHDFNRLCCCVRADQTPEEACGLTYDVTSTSAPSEDPMMANSKHIDGEGMFFVAVLAAIVSV